MIADRHVATPLSGFEPARVRPGVRVGPVARLLFVTSLLSTIGGCRGEFAGQQRRNTTTPVLADGALIPSPRLIVGRTIAVDQTQRFAFVDLATDAPNGAMIAGSELQTRTLDLRDTGRLEVSRQRRGRTLGTKIVEGQPSPGDEVVWLAP